MIGEEDARRRRPRADLPAWTTPADRPLGSGAAPPPVSFWLVTDHPSTRPRTRRRRAAPTTGPVQYKGADLEPERGPGLGCFRFQLVVLVFLIVLTPLSVVWQWPAAVSAVLLFVVIGLLLVTGQTIIFLLRLVAADRRGRRRPLASGTKTVGELEDAAGRRPARAATSRDRAAAGEPTRHRPEGPVRQ